MSNLPPHAIQGLIRRIKAHTSMSSLKAHWGGIAREYQHHPDVQAARDGMKAVLS